MIVDMAALSQMPTVYSRAEQVFENLRQPSQFCRPFHQIRPSASETKKVMFNNDVMFGTQAAIVVPHDGDLMTGATLAVKLHKMSNEFPTSVAAYYPIEALVKRVTLSVGGTLIDTHTSNWFRLYDEYVRTHEESQNYRRIANFDPDTLTTAVTCTETLFLPLVFSFFRDKRSALPLCSLPNTDVILSFTFASAEEVGVQPDVFEASLYVDYALVDPYVRQSLLRPFQLMFEQVQWNGGQLVDPAQTESFVNVRARLGFKRPVKALFWLLNETESNNPDRSMHARWVGDAAGTYLALQPSQNDFGGYNLLQSISEKLAPVRLARLTFNGVDRFPPRFARFFNTIHPLHACRRAPLPGSYVYAFSDDVPSLQPTPGLCNFSNFNDIQLSLQLKKTTPCSVTDTTAFAGSNAEDCAKNINTLCGLDVFAWSYNICTVQAGSLTVQLTA